MKRISVFILSLAALMMLVCGCAQEKPPSVISDIVPQIKNDDCVMGIRTRSANSHGAVYIRGDDGQSRRGLELLDEYDLTEMTLTETDPREEGFLGSDVYYVKWKDGGCQIGVHLEAEGDSPWQLRFLFDTGETLYYTGEMSNVPGLDQLNSELHTAVAEGATLAYPLDSEGTAITVDNAIIAMDYFENSSNVAAKEPDTDQYTFDLSLKIDRSDYILATFYNYEIPPEMSFLVNPPLEISDTQYLLDTTSGVFARVTGDAELISQLPEGALSSLLRHLGVK